MIGYGSTRTRPTARAGVYGLVLRRCGNGDALRRLRLCVHDFLGTSTSSQSQIHVISCRQPEHGRTWPSKLTRLFGVVAVKILIKRRRAIEIMLRTVTASLRPSAGNRRSLDATLRIC